MPIPLHAIIPAGGAGTRLWPLSRRSFPKFLLDLTGEGQTLLQGTVARLEPLSASITVVTGSRHFLDVVAQVPQWRDESEEGRGWFSGEVIAEPTPRDSMAAIGLAAYVIGERYGDEAIVGSFAADHLIQNNSAFERAVRTAIAGAEKGYLATIGITPTEPSTAFGYIQRGAPPLQDSLFPVERFVEKPEADVAAKYVEDGYLWNAGIFVVKVQKLKAALRRHLPQMDTHLTSLAREYVSAGGVTGKPVEVALAQWEQLPKIAIDYALAEPLSLENQVVVAQADANLGWSDVGDFQTLSQLRSRTTAQDPLLISFDSENTSIIRGGGTCANKMVVVVGTDNLVVVDTSDALLIANADQSQQVKDAVEELKKIGRGDLL